jgi:hypothetical protein
LSGKIGHTSSGGNHEVLHTHDKGNDPEEAEKEEPNHVGYFVISFDSSEERWLV